MQHEVLAACVGHAGNIIQRQWIVEKSFAATATSTGAAKGSRGRYQFSVRQGIDFLDYGEVEAINRVVHLGSLYVLLQQFADPDGRLAHDRLDAIAAVIEQQQQQDNCDRGYSCNGMNSRPTMLSRTATIKQAIGGRTSSRGGSGGAGNARNSLYVQALRVGIDEVLQDYWQLVVDIEKECMGDPALPISYIHHRTRHNLLVFPALVEVCELVTYRRLKGAQVLELLYSSARVGTPVVQTRLERLLWHCQQVWYNQSLAWLLHGVLVDPHSEYMVQHNGHPAGGNSDVNAVLSGKFDEGEAEAAKAFRRERAGQGDEASSEDAEIEWHTDFTVRLAMLPALFIPARLSQTILFVGKAVRVLQAVGRRGGRGGGGYGVGPAGYAGGGLSDRGWSSLSAASSYEDMERGGGGGGGDGGVSGGGNMHRQSKQGEKERGDEDDIMAFAREWETLKRRPSFHLLEVEHAVDTIYVVVARRLHHLVVVQARLPEHLRAIKAYLLLGHGDLFHTLFQEGRSIFLKPPTAKAAADLSAGPYAISARACNLDDDEHFQRTRLVLDVPSFHRNQFHSVAQFRLAGDATHSMDAALVTLCGQDMDALEMPYGTSESEGRGALWYGTRRQVLHGFYTAFCVRQIIYQQPQETDDVGSARTARSLGPSGVSFVLQNHRSRVLGQGGRGLGSWAVPNSLSVCLDLSGLGPPGWRRAPVGDDKGGGGGGGGGGHANADTSFESTDEGVQADAEAILYVTICSRNIVESSQHHYSAGGDDGGFDDSRGGGGGGGGEGDGSGGSGDNGGGGEVGRVRLLASAAISRQDLEAATAIFMHVQYGVLTPAEAARAYQSGQADGQDPKSPMLGLRIYVDDPELRRPPKLVVPLVIPRYLQLEGDSAAYVGLTASGRQQAIQLVQWSFNSLIVTEGNDNSSNNNNNSSSSPTIASLSSDVINRCSGNGSVGGGNGAVEVGWSALQLQYKVEWPLHLVLSYEALQQYNRVFSILLAVKRASFEIDRLWPTLMQQRYRKLSREDNIWLVPLWTLRASMSFFVNNVMSYLQLDAVEAEYSKMQDEIAVAKDFNMVVKAHNRFITGLRNKCYIDVVVVNQAIHRVLHCVHALCLLFQIHNDAASIPHTEVVRVSEQYSKEVRQLFVIIERVGEKELTLRLNYNGFFSK